MQVEVDVECMQANFGGCGLSGFGDSNLAKFPFLNMDYSPWGSKNGINPKKHASRVGCEMQVQ